MLKGHSNENRAIRYTPLGKRGCFGVALLLMLEEVVMFLFRIYDKRQISETDLFLAVIVNIFILSVIVYGTFGIPESAIMDTFGIHIRTRTSPNLHFVPWKAIHDIYYIPSKSYFHSYVALATVPVVESHNEFVLFREFPSREKLFRYRLDEAMSKLVKGKISKDEFDTQELFLLALSKKEYAQLKVMWENCLKNQ